MTKKTWAIIVDDTCGKFLHSTDTDREKQVMVGRLLKTMYKENGRVYFFECLGEIIEEEENGRTESIEYCKA